MSQEVIPIVIAGTFGVIGTIVGVAMTTWLGRSGDRRRLAAEDARRWLANRRETYSAFLALASSMLREIDNVACFLSYEGTETVSSDDETFIAEGLAEVFERWDTELQPALGDVQLLASAQVADLADRTCGALLEVTGVVEHRGVFVDFYPQWFRAQDLLGVLRNAMRRELGLVDEIQTALPREPLWPWLPDRPSEEDYIRRQAQIPGRPPLTKRESARLASASARARPR